VVLFSGILFILYVLVLDGVLSLNDFVEQHELGWVEWVWKEFPDEIFVIQQTLIFEEIDHLGKCESEPFTAALSLCFWSSYLSDS
jgi:hypothetical protein